MFKDLTHKDNKLFPILVIGLPISHTSKRKNGRLRGQSVAWFLKLCLKSRLETPRLNLGCHFDNQLYSISCATQDDVDDGIYVGDVDFAITVYIGCRVAAATKDGVDDGIHICYVHF